MKKKDDMFSDNWVLVWVFIIVILVIIFICYYVYICLSSRYYFCHGCNTHLRDCECENRFQYCRHCDTGTRRCKCDYKFKVINKYKKNKY